MSKFPAQRSREFFCPSREFSRGSREFHGPQVSVHCLHACFAPAERDLFSLAFFAGEEEQMADGERSRERYGEAFWRAHHEAWRQRDLNQREHCEAQGLPLKAFGNWRRALTGAAHVTARTVPSSARRWYGATAESLT